jgi:iron(III) transport system substrate-binding protein
VPRAHRSRALAIAAATVVGLTGLASCSSDSDRLTIYSGRTKDLIDPLLQQYAQETGNKIDVRYGDSADLALQIEEEGDKSPADIFLSQSPGAMDYLSGASRLTALPATVLDQVEERFRSPKGEWVGLSGRVRVLVYNADDVEEADLPSSVFDLVDPKYKDMVAVAPTNGSFQDFVTAMRQAVGEDETRVWLEELVANGAKSYANNVAIIQAVGRGEVPMGLVNHYYNERAKVEDPNVKTVNHSFDAGDLGNLILVTGAGVVAGSDQQDEAQEFVTYLLGRQAQEYFAEETLEYPLAAGVQPAVDLPALSSIQAPQEDLSTLGDLAVTARLIDESGLSSG